MSEFILSNAARSQLLALGRTNQTISSLTRQTTTGLRVYDPSIDPAAWGQAKDLEAEAEVRRARATNLTQSLQSVKTALNAIDAIGEILDQMQAVIDSVATQPTYATYYAGVQARNAGINNAASTWNRLAKEINNLAADASYSGSNLLADTDTRVGVWASDTITADLGGGSSYSVGGNFIGVAGVITGFFTFANEAIVTNGDGLHSSTDLSINNTNVGTTGNWTTSTQVGIYRPANNNSETDTSGGVGINVDARYISDASTRAMSAEYWANAGAGVGNMVLMGGMANALAGTVERIGLGLNFATTYAGFTMQAGRDAARDDLQYAKQTLAAFATQLGASANYIQAQIDFNTKLAVIEDEGAKKLTGVDLNAAGAQLLAAQTLQKVAVSAIDSSVNSQANGALALLKLLNSSGN